MKKIFSVCLVFMICIGLGGCKSEERYSNKEVEQILEDNNWNIYVDGEEFQVSDSSGILIFGSYFDTSDDYFLFYSNSKMNSGTYEIISTIKSDTETTKLQKEYSDELKNDLNEKLSEINLDEQYFIDYFKSKMNLDE